SEEADRNHAEFERKLRVLQRRLIGRDVEVAGEGTPGELHEARSLDRERDLRDAAPSRLRVRHEQRKQRMRLIDLHIDAWNKRAPRECGELCAKRAGRGDARSGKRCGWRVGISHVSSLCGPSCRLPESLSGVLVRV